MNVFMWGLGQRTINKQVILTEAVHIFTRRQIIYHLVKLAIVLCLTVTIKGIYQGKDTVLIGLSLTIIHKRQISNYSICFNAILHILHKYFNYCIDRSVSYNHTQKTNI